MKYTLEQMTELVAAAVHTDMQGLLAGAGDVNVSFRVAKRESVWYMARGVQETHIKVGHIRTEFVALGLNVGTVRPIRVILSDTIRFTAERNPYTEHVVFTLSYRAGANSEYVYAKLEGVPDPIADQAKRWVTHCLPRLIDVQNSKPAESDAE